MSKTVKMKRFGRVKNFAIAPYHQDMLDELMKAHGFANESELLRHLIEWEWEFIHVWDEKGGAS